MPRTKFLALGVLLSTGSALAEYVDLPRAEQLKAFTAAGFNQQTTRCELDEEGCYTPVTMEIIKDLNGDGRLDAVIAEGSTLCYGRTGQGYFIFSQQANGQWRLVGKGEGMPQFLPQRGVDGWPDIEIAGPGIQPPVLRYDGTAYRPSRQP